MRIAARFLPVHDVVDPAQCAQGRGSALHWIPHLAKSHAFEVLHVDGSELGHAEGTEAEGGSLVVDAATGKPGKGGVVPEVGVDGNHASQFQVLKRE